MFRAMAWKELRESFGIGLLGLVGCVLLSRMSGGQGQVPFFNDGISGVIIFVSALIAISLGLRQTLGESVRGTYLLLFHRPATRNWLIGVKLLVGLLVYLTVGAIPIVVYGIWVGTPGAYASPFQWSMTVPSWVAWFGMTVLYLAAFLTGIRPGRWYRSRLLPLVAGILTVALGMALNQNADVRLAWVVVLTVAADMWLIALIVFVGKARDYP
jgi:hypothetical protein